MVLTKTDTILKSMNLLVTQCVTLVVMIVVGFVLQLNGISVGVVTYGSTKRVVVESIRSLAN